MRNGYIGYNKGMLSIKLDQRPLVCLIQAKKVKGKHHQAARAKRATVDQDKRKQ